MKIVITGVETNNKGAELMLYAILQEIERKWPEATVYISKGRIRQGLDYINTKLDFRFIPFEKIEERLHLVSLFRMLRIPFKFLPHSVAIGKIDYYIDGSGYRYSDQFKLSSDYAKGLNIQFSTYRKQGTKIIFLPQAFGPFEKKATKEVLSVLGEYASIIMPREKVSFNYLETSGLIDMKKVQLFTDFTSLVESIFPVQYEYLRDGVCVIPNRQMINKGAISREDYLKLLKAVISISKMSGHQVFLLNHEGLKDEQLCRELQKEVSDELVIVSKLNALEVKGIIASAYLVISSRFHGVASSLNAGVPCLATSWSYKYSELFNDYKMEDCVMPLNNMDEVQNKLLDFLKEEKNNKIRSILSQQTHLIKEETQNMWKTVWSC